MSSLLIVLVSLAMAAPPREAPAASQSSGVVAQSPVAQSPAIKSPDTEAADAKTDRGLSVEKSMRKRTGRELLAAVRETLPRLARPKNEDLEAAVEELLFVHQELLADKTMAISQRAYYKEKVEFRLEQLSGELKKRIARNKRLGKRKLPETIRQGSQQLEQRVARPPVAPAQPPLAGGYAASPGGMMPSDDYGQQLVDLIQATIAPSSWDVNGGLGTIHYWRPGRALVIRQTGAVHEEMGGVLGQLRRAGP